MTQRKFEPQAWFAANFRYTLFLSSGEYGWRDLERFLLVDRVGHCEYFASAMVLLLRRQATKPPPRWIARLEREAATLRKIGLTRAKAAVTAFYCRHYGA